MNSANSLIELAAPFGGGRADRQSRYRLANFTNWQASSWEDRALVVLTLCVGNGTNKPAQATVPAY